MRLILKFLVLFFAVGARAESIAEYAYQTTIETGAEAIWYQASVPASVRLRATYSDMRDLRVFNAEGESLPFALTQTATETVSTPLVWTLLLMAGMVLNLLRNRNKDAKATGD